MKNIYLIILATVLSSCLTSNRATSRIESVDNELREKFAISDQVFYKKYLDAYGLAIVTSDKVPDVALFEAEYVINKMLEGRDDIRKMIIKNKVHVSIMAHDEFTTDIPEHSTLKSAPFWDRRARGLGATVTRPVITCAAENLLNYKGDPYENQAILVHEFAHVIHQMGLNYMPGDFDKRLWECYCRNIKEKGLWKKTYAGSNHIEYFAEGVMNWFNCNTENDSLHNHVNTREEMKAYDPDLSAILAEVFGDNSWSYLPPKQRTNKADLSHFAEYDFDDSPVFKWPPYLIRVTEKKLVHFIDELRYQQAIGSPKAETKK